MSPLGLFDQLDRFPWSSPCCAEGPGTHVPDELRKMAVAQDEESGSRAYWALDNSVVVQGSLYEAAQWIVFALLGALKVGSEVGRKLSLELLIQMSWGESNPDAVARGHADLGGVVRAEVGLGLATFYDLLGSSDDDEVRDSVLELISWVDPDPIRLVAAARVVAASDSSASIRELAQGIVEERAT